MIDFIKNCLSLNLNDYENIGIDFEINKLVLFVMLAFCVAAVLLSFYRGTIRLVVMQLIRHSACDENSAKTLKNIGLGDNKIAKYMLKGDNLLTKVVRRVGEVKYSYEEYMEKKKAKTLDDGKINIDDASFYIDPEMRERADIIAEKYVTSAQRTAMSILLIVALGICLILVMPGMLNLINTLLNNIKM